MIKLVQYPGREVELLSYNDLIQSFEKEEGWEIEELGTASDGESPIYGMAYGDLERKPVIFITVAIHGNEWVPVYFAQEFRRIWHNPRMHPNYRVIQKLKQTFSIYCMPLCNPYGYKMRYVTGDEGQGRQNFNGVDCNRDFLSEDPQAETVLIKEKFLKLSPVSLIDCHSYIIAEALGYGDPAEPFYRQMFYYTLDNIARTIEPYPINQEVWEQVNLVRPFRSHIPRYRDQEFGLGQGKAWANHQINKYGKKPTSFLIEEHRRGPTKRGMTFGINSLIVLSYHIWQLWSENKQRVSWRNNL